MMRLRLSVHLLRLSIVPLTLSIALACGSVVTQLQVQGKTDKSGPALPSRKDRVGSAPAQPTKDETEAASVQAASGIKAIGEGVHKLRRAAHEMMAELQRPKLEVVSEPDVIGPIIMPAIPDPGAGMPAGPYLPPRKKWLDFYLSDMEQLVQFIDEERETTVIPEIKKGVVSGPWSQMQAKSEDAKSHCLKLEPLIQGPQFDRDAISAEALAIYRDAEDMDKLRKQVFHIIKD